MRLLSELKVSITRRTAKGSIKDTAAVKVRAKKAAKIVNLYGVRKGQRALRADKLFVGSRSITSPLTTSVLAILKFSRHHVKDKRFNNGQGWD